MPNILEVYFLETMERHSEMEEYVSSPIPSGSNVTTKFIQTNNGFFVMFWREINMHFIYLVKNTMCFLKKEKW